MSRSKILSRVLDTLDGEIASAEKLLRELRSARDAVAAMPELAKTSVSESGGYIDGSGPLASAIARVLFDAYPQTLNLSQIMTLVGTKINNAFDYSTADVQCILRQYPSKFISEAIVPKVGGALYRLTTTHSDLMRGAGTTTQENNPEETTEDPAIGLYEAMVDVLCAAWPTPVALSEVADAAAKRPGMAGISFTTDTVRDILFYNQNKFTRTEDRFGNVRYRLSDMFAKELDDQ